jgi:hypothetical protein
MAALAALAISLICVAAGDRRLLGGRWPEWLLSAGAGVGLAYVVVHLLPGLADAARVVGEEADGRIPFAEAAIYLVVLVGILATLVLRSWQHGRHGSQPHPGLRIAQPVGSALIVGYLIAVRDDPEVQPLLLFAVAIGLHLLVNAHTLTAKMDSPLGGLALAAAVVGGFGLGSLWQAPEAMVAAFVALLAGGVTARTLHEVVDEDRHLLALTGGAAAETALLLGLG